MNKEFYKTKTELIKALANPTRLMIVDCLRSGEKTVSEIIDLIKEEQSNVSKSLSILKNQNIVQDKKIGLNVYYSLKCGCINDFFNCLDNLIKENLRHNQNLLKHYEELER